MIGPALFQMVFIFLFILPLIMMRSFAEERKQKTEELLVTSPISTMEVVWGKFFGSLAFIMVMVFPTILYQVVLHRYAAFELGPVLTGYTGILLFAAMGISIGLFTSSLTENQIISAIITFVVLLFLFIITFINAGEGSLLGKILEYVSVTTHIRNTLEGTIDSRDLVYFLSTIFLFTFLTQRTLEARGWR